ncbi:META domain-containing protein [Synechococcus elongatus]|uniref:META domain-containing protein n=1 Tax=Synechococcus elongatus PCC 11801 TaxID=2219813 RepID=A0AAN1UV84_SYNEL|nr:META domain-containing protein [Synechococcus elongatus]AZB73355.1 META domain-containing protein [Synechococcus elongatus PCC 11801]
MKACRPHFSHPSNLHWTFGLLGLIAIAQPLPLKAMPLSNSEAPPLENTTWELVSFVQRGQEQAAAIAPEQQAILKLQSEPNNPQLQGSTGCNSFFGSYRWEPKTAQLTLQPAGSTLRACLSPDLNQQEQALFTGLPQVTTYTLAGDHLQLRNASQEILFTFRVPPMLALTETAWVLQQYNNGKGALTTPIAGSMVTAQFQFDAENQRLSGSASCNRYFASYQVQQQQLTIGSIGSTRKACAPDQMQQEQSFLQLLKATRSYQIEGDRLQLYDGQQQVLAVFSAQVQR